MKTVCGIRHFRLALLAGCLFVVLLALSLVPDIGQFRKPNVRDRLDLQLTLDAMLRWMSVWDNVPTTNQELFRWAHKNDLLADISYIDKCFVTERFCDRWGNEIYFVHVKDELIGIGSSGPDGLWGGNSRDDIIVYVVGYEEKDRQ